MSELEKIMPDLELCALIPKGEFHKTALIWRYVGKRYHAETPTVFEQYEPSIRYSEHEKNIPAPTLAEIFSEDNVLFGWGKKDKVWYYWVHGKSRGTIHGKDKRRENAALKLWLKLNKIEVI